MKRVVPAIVSIILLLASCGKEPAVTPWDFNDPVEQEDTTVVVVTPPAPAEYAALLTEFKKGARLFWVKFEADSTVLHFNDSKTLSLPVATMPVEELGSGKPRTLSVNYDGLWVVGSEETGIPCDRELGDSHAYPIYLCFHKPETEDGMFYMYLSNGKAFEMKCERYAKVTGHLPKVYITATRNIKNLVKEKYDEGRIEIYDPDHIYSDVEELKVETSLRLRGNSTSSMPKRPLRLKFHEKKEVLGMPANKDWNLLANYSDKSLLRNMTAMEISRICGMKWTPRMTSVELWYNNSYQGVYNLCEVCEVAKHRVDIDPEGKGDVYLEIDARYGEDVWFNTPINGVPITFKDPEHPSASLLAEIKDLFKKFEAALVANNGTAKQYGDYESLVNYYIINELTKNVDGNLSLSTFISVERGQPFEMSNVWDFDLCLGNCDYLDNNGPTGWWTKNACWYSRLFKDKEFVTLLKKRWAEVYPDLEHIPEYIDQQVALIGDAQYRNFNTWAILKVYVWPNYKIPGSYAGEIDWLKEFYTTRLKWLNTQIQFTQIPK